MCRRWSPEKFEPVAARRVTAAVTGGGRGAVLGLGTPQASQHPGLTAAGLGWTSARPQPTLTQHDRALTYHIVCFGFHYYTKKELCLSLELTFITIILIAFDYCYI